MSKEKTFFKITELSETFEAGDWLKVIATFPEADMRTRMHLSVLVWQVKAQLAIAQQLSIVSKHLGEIVDRSKVGA